jgi:ATP-dependent RNA helicase DDX21
MIPERSV